MPGTYEVLDHIPDEVPPYSVTSDGVNWAAVEGWTMANLMNGVVVTDEEAIPFSDVTLEDVHISNGELVDSLRWEEMDMAVGVEVPGGGLFLALSTVDDDVVSTVLLPYGLFGAAFGAPHEFRSAVAAILGQLVGQGTVDVFDGNLDWLFTPPAAPIRAAKMRKLPREVTA